MDLRLGMQTCRERASGACSAFAPAPVPGVDTPAKAHSGSAHPPSVDTRQPRPVGLWVGSLRNRA